MPSLYKILITQDGKLWEKLTSEKPIRKYTNANQKEKFDWCIKQSFLNNKPYMPGHILQDSTEDNFGFYLKRYKKIYDKYLSKTLKFEKALSEEIQNAYITGLGNEFSTGKFYSVASSSRFAISSFSENNKGIVELLKN